MQTYISFFVLHYLERMTPVTWDYKKQLKKILVKINKDLFFYLYIFLFVFIYKLSLYIS